MKKLYSIVASAVISALSFTASAQTSYTILEDLTKSKITNADFTADEAVNGLVRTYSKDMQDDGVGAGGTEMYGQQLITGWTALNPTDNIKNDPSAVSGDARAAAIFTYRGEDDDEPTAKLGGEFFAPFDYDCPGNTGKALGLVGVWGATIQYTQDVTLAPGAYMLIIPICNTAGTGTLTKNLMGFIADSGAEYLVDKKTYDVGLMHNDTVVFKLTAETSGKLSVGYQAGNVGSASAPHLFIDGVQLYSIDQAQLDAAEVIAAKEQLLAVIEEGGELGVETKEANIVYLNPNATLAEVLAAIESQKAINAAGVVDLSEFFITNPHFNLDEPITGGICTYDYDMEKNSVNYFGMQPLTGWVATFPSDNTVLSGRKDGDAGANGRACGVYTIGERAFLGGADFLAPMTMSDGTTEGRVLGFLTAWSATAQYKQAVTIPAGKYTLTISYYNAAGGNAINKNLMGFIADSGEEYLSDVKTFKIGSWEQMKIVFTLDEPTSGYFTLGFQAAHVGSANMPHFFIDGITLNYVGDANFDPSLLALQAAVSSATNMLDKPFYEELKEQLREVISAGADLVSSQSDDAEANKAAADAINETVSEVSSSIKAYEKLQNFADNALADALLKYESIEDLFGQLEELNDEVTLGALQEYNWSNAQIDEAIASLDSMIINGVQKYWDEAVAAGEPLSESLDITKLIQGLTFESNANGWTSDNGNVSIEHACAEIYDKSPFTVTRTVENMPAGTYTVKTRAFYRTGANADNYAQYQDDKAPKAFIWAGHNKAGIANVAELAVEASEAPANYSEADAGIYVPNNRTVAQQIFDDKDITVVETSVQTVLPQTGDLKFGICADQLDATSWVVWYSFEIAYNALDEDILDAEIEGLIAEATEKLELVEGNAQAVSDLEKSSAKGSDALSSTKVDEKIAAAVALNAAIDYANAGVALAEKINAMVESYDQLSNEYDIESTDDKFFSLIAAASSGQYESNEQIQGYIDQFPTAWAAYVLAQPALATASEENPCDLTAIILNPAFEAGNADNWVFTAAEEDKPIGQNQGFQSNNEYSNPEADIVISKFIEAWRPNGTILNDGTISQEIKVALPVGYYVLEVNGYAVNQTAVPEEGTKGVYLMAKNGENTYTTEMCVDTIAGIPEHHVLEFQSDGTNLTTIGICVEGTNASWLVADNFTLKYIGGSASTGIISDFIQSIMSRIVGIYSLDGQQKKRVTKGINIIKMKTGETLKIYSNEDL